MGLADWAGNAAAHIGTNCVGFAGGIAGDGAACQANFMEHAGVPEAMLQAWNDHGDLELADRLLAALCGAEAIGGDVRGRQSAAILVVSADTTKADPLADVRVDDHAEPLEELSRLLRISHAYQRADQGDQYIAAGNTLPALDEYGAARALAPEIGELAFWHGLALAESGDIEGALPLLDESCERRPQMRLLVQRLQDAGWIALTDDALRVLDGSRHRP